MSKKPKSLINRIFLIPILILLVSFMLISTSFKLVLTSYSASLSLKALNEEFSYMESIYNGEDQAFGFEDRTNSDSLVVNAKLFFLDQDLNLIDRKEFWSSEADRKKALQISSYFKGMDSSIFPYTIKNISIDNKSYVIEYRLFNIEFDKEGFITKAKNDELKGGYYAIAYCDISSVQSLISTMNLILFIILIAIAILSILVLLGLLRKVKKSFKVLEGFLIKIGKREKLKDKPKLDYLEFESVISTTLKMEKEIQLSEEIQKKFFQNSSHELRTPLMSIQGYTEALKYGVAKDKDKAYNIILAESKKMASLVEEILVLSKFENSKLKFEKINMLEVLDISLTSKSYLIDEKGLKVDFKTDKDEVMVLADEKMLERACSNLISNSIRYAKNIISIKVEILADRVLCHVIDDGDGIDEEDLPHIFDRFYKGKGGNFGIGLSMTKEIAEKSGGRLYIGQGENTDFILELPLLDK